MTGLNMANAFKSLSRRTGSVLAVVCLAGTLAGCGGSNVELNGSLFEVMGVAGNSLSGKKEEPQLASRGPLIVPPSAEALPEPGSAAAVAAAPTDQSWPQDPDELKTAQAEASTAEAKKKCEEGNFKNTKPEEFESLNGGAAKRGCGSILKAIFGSATSSATE